MQTSQAAAPARLRAAGLSYSYGRRAALSPLELQVQPGELVGLLGPNGSGKSTALALLAGILPAPDQLQLSLDGQRTHPRDGAYRRALAVVFQHPSLDPRLSIRQNLELAFSMRGLKGEAHASAVERGLKEAGVLERSSEAVKTLSGGLARRVDLARALGHDPGLILLDEPTSGLDEHSSRAFWSQLEARRAQGTSILVATHRVDEAARCDRLILLREGKVVLETTPAALIERAGGSTIELRLKGCESFEAARDQLKRVAAEFADETGEGARAGTLLIPGGDATRLLALVKLVGETLGEESIEWIGLRQPSLADAFVRETGTRLEDEG